MQTKFYQHWINMTKGYMLLYNSTNDLVNEGHTNNCARVTMQACMLFTRAELKVLKQMFLFARAELKVLKEMFLFARAELKVPNSKIQLS